MTREPPSGGAPATFIFTDIIDSASLWELSEDDMYATLRRHNEIIRQSLVRFGGQEVKHTGDGFFIHFPSPVQSFQFLLTVLKALKAEPWCQTVVEYRKKQDMLQGIVGSDGTLKDRGLIIRAGAHHGQPYAREMRGANRYDYYGRAINKASRVDSQAVGDSIALSDDFIMAFYEELAGIAIPASELHDGLRRQILLTQALDSEFEIRFRGLCALKGFSGQSYITLVQVRR